jgi:hypothetical protein
MVMDGVCKNPSLMKSENLVLFDAVVYSEIPSVLLHLSLKIIKNIFYQSEGSRFNCMTIYFVELNYKIERQFKKIVAATEFPLSQ